MATTHENLNHTSLLPSSLPSSDILLPLFSGSSQAFKSIPKFGSTMEQFNLRAIRMKMMENTPSYLQGVISSIQQYSTSELALYVSLTLAAYVLLVRSLRYRRIRQLEAHYNYRTRASMAKMTDHEAWEIQRAMAQYEFPFSIEKSLQFALFRTYGIPTISTTLIKTKQFSNNLYSGKRYVDTCILIGEFIVHSPATVRSRIGLARTKYLHNGYRKSGSVREEDMLYTLSLFATEPIRFVNLYEWRSATDLERCAMGVFWKSVGDALGIDYAAFLPSAKAAAEAGKTNGYTDGIHWLDEITAWAQDYEKRAMVPAQTNRDTADQTTAILTYALPRPFKFIGNWFVSSMMDDRLRIAMLYPRAPRIVENMFWLAFEARKLFLRNLCLPRPEFMRHVAFTEKPDRQTGAYHVTNWTAEPFYVKPTLWNRWLSPSAIVARILRFPLPGDQGDKYYPQGYDLGDMGPKKFEGRGKDYLEREMNTLEKERTGQCPFM
ncbi:hypothetical protein TCE0_042r14749 [Talaromyces pinophilus]|uniref:ER-bound oxygenase mpaB/mpaB'/Rubber oxygenase catalytic domain-containing protein n=1 Tax=Talaromyces pinophilus TaxID=128442 RepID=A0A6V8HJT2_TALPI|nr:hypothetical protein TCE0_042r14749 [Talaromyces pinophilus]